jgi:hypothetical protein
MLYNATTLLNDVTNNLLLDGNDVNVINGNIDSLYYDTNCFVNKFKNSNQPLILSINIQSLLSKHQELKTFITELKNNGIVIDVLVIQETWDYKCKNLVDIPNYHKFISKCREKSRGGGVGFYVHNTLSYKMLDSSMYHVEKIYECMMIELVIQKTKYILCNVYRSPSPINRMSLADQHNSFVSKLENMMSNLSDNNVISYVFLDANLNLLNYNTDVNCRQYINAALSNGFYQMITRATRIQGDSYSLIDHIFTNTKNIVPECGVLVSDISDHFFTCVSLPCQKKPKPSNSTKNAFSLT